MVDYGWGPVSDGAPAAQVHAPTRQKTETAATMALILSLCGIFTWGLSCIVALFVAAGAKRNVAVSPDTRKGEGLALAAQIISVVSLLLAAGIATAIFAA
jgi:hypothetical protein